MTVLATLPLCLVTTLVIGLPSKIENKSGLTNASRVSKWMQGVGGCKGWVHGGGRSTTRCCDGRDLPPASTKPSPTARPASPIRACCLSSTMDAVEHEYWGERTWRMAQLLYMFLRFRRGFDCLQAQEVMWAWLTYRTRRTWLLNALHWHGKPNARQGPGF